MLGERLFERGKSEHRKECARYAVSSAVGKCKYLVMLDFHSLIKIARYYANRLGEYKVVAKNFANLFLRECRPLYPLCVADAGRVFVVGFGASLRFGGDGGIERGYLGLQLAYPVAVGLVCLLAIRAWAVLCACCSHVVIF